MVPLWMLPQALVAERFILKPSEQVPLSCIRLAEMLKEAGFLMVFLISLWWTRNC